MTRPLPKHRAREYETIFIMHPESSGDQIDKVAVRVQEVMTRLDGKLLRAENWGRKRLAYNVRKQQKGIYIYVRYLGYQDMVHELERNLRMLDPVLKYLTVKVDEDVDPAARPVSPENISFLASIDEEAVADHDDDTEAQADEEADADGDADADEEAEDDDPDASDADDAAPAADDGDETE